MSLRFPKWIARIKQRAPARLTSHRDWPAFEVELDRILQEVRDHIAERAYERAYARAYAYVREPVEDDEGTLMARALGLIP